MRALRVITAFLASAAVTAALGAAASTQFVLAALADLGATIPLGIRLAMTFDDIAGMGPLYAVIVAVAFLIAFLVAAWLVRWRASRRRATVYALAGAAAVLMTLLLMRATFDITAIAGTRTLAGVLVQGLMGAVGGYVFARLSGSRGPARSPI